LLPGDEDGESVVLQGLQELKKFVIDGALTFMSPAGAPITLPANLKSITFNTGDALEQWNCFKVLPFASVRGFTLADGTKYIADLRCDNGGYFGGYYPVQATPGGTYYEDLKSHILPQGKIIIFLPNPSEERGKYIEWIFNRAPWLGYEGIPEKGYTSGGEIANYNLVEQEYIPYSQLPIKENFTPNSVLSESVYLEDVISLKGIELIHIALQSPYSSMFSMMYAYAHAHQTTKYPELLSNCGLGDISQLNYQELNGKIKRFFRTETTSYTDQQQNQTNILLTKYEISLWSELGGSLHKLFHDYREGFIQGGYARIMQYNEEQENTGDLLLRIIKPELPEFYACLFKELPSNVRTKMIKILANKPNLFEYRVLSNTIGRNDNSVFFNNNPDEETIFNYLLETTPEKDFKDVVKIFMDDPSLYYKAYNSLNEPFPINGSLDVWGVKSFVGALYIMCASYYDAGIRPLQSETVALYTDGTQNPLRTNVEIDNFASIMSFNENIKIRNPNKYYIHSYNDDVDVCEGTSLWTPTGTFIRHSDNKDGPPMWVQSTPCPGLHSELLKDSGSPFDPMIIRIDRDIKFSNGTLDQVEFKAIDRHTYVVPLFYGKYLMETLTDASQDQQTRVMLNALTIMLNAEAWAETKGLQLIFAVVESLYSAVDILYVSELDYEYELTGYHPHAEWIRQAWSEFGYLSLGATTIAFTDLLTGSARIELGNIITLHQRLKVAAPDKLPLYYSNIRGTIAKLKEFKNTLQPSSLAYAKTSGIISRLEAQLAQISIIDVRGSSLNVFSISEFDLSISFRSSFGNEPIKIGDGIMDGGIYKIAPLRSMLTGDMSGLEILETLNGVFYKNIDDVWSYGNVQVLGRRTGNAMNEFDNIKIKGVSAVSDPLASEFPAVFRKFQDKRWDFSVHFSELESIFPKNGSSQAAWLRYADEFDDGADGIANFKQRILSLSNENAAFVNLMKETGTADIAFKLLDDINNPGIRDAVQIFFLQLSNNLIELEYTLQAINSLIKSDLPHLNSYGSFLARLEEPGFMSAFLNSGDNVLIYSILHRHGYGNMLPTDANTYSVIASSFSYNGQSGLQAFLNFTNTIGDGTGNFSATQLLNTTLDNARELINNGFTPPHNVKLIHIEPNKIGITANGNILIGEFEIGQFTPFSPVQGGPAIPNTNIEGYQIVNNSGTLRFSN
jgi:hypothetical protein